MTVLWALALAPASQAAPVTVNCDAGGNLQARINTAAAGATILVKGTCVGNFTITGKGLTLKGSPSATLEGNDVFRPLGINAPGKVVHLAGMTITGGIADAPGGGGILSLAAGLTLNKVNVSNNLTTSSSGEGLGGGIFATGNLTLTNTTISGNRARTTGSGSEADGGGIALVNGHLTVTDSTISGNRASADLTTGDAHANGGGIFVSNGRLTMSGSTVSANRAVATGPAIASVFGGGIASESSAQPDSVTGSLITGNSATAVSPSATASASGGGFDGVQTNLTATRLLANVAIASGSTAGAVGGGAATEDLTLVHSTISGNRLRVASTSGDANASGAGADGESSITLTSSTVSRNAALAVTSGTFGANAAGGGVDAPAVNVENSTVALNHLTARSTSSASANARGGGVLAALNGSVVGGTVAGNTAVATGSTHTAAGGGLSATSGLTLEGTIVANNAAASGPDCEGGPTSNGHNLVGKPVGCSFTKKTGDIVGKDPKLGPLAGNGGPTQTMAIGQLSPARDAVPNPACTLATDQRGVHRPQGPACDMGAYELKAP